MFVATQNLALQGSQTSNVQVKLTLYEWDGVTPSVDRATGALGSNLTDHTTVVKVTKYKEFQQS